MEIQEKSREDQVKELKEKRDKLVERLDTGAEAIQAKRLQGYDVSSLEDFWITLLRQYEVVCDTLRELYLSDKSN